MAKTHQPVSSSASRALGEIAAKREAKIRQAVGLAAKEAKAGKQRFLRDVDDQSLKATLYKALR